MRTLYEFVGELDMRRWRWLDVGTFYAAIFCLLGETIATFAAPGVVGQRGLLPQIASTFAFWWLVACGLYRALDSLDRK